MDSFTNMDFVESVEENHMLMSFEETSNTLVVDDVEVQLDFQLGDEDLGVSLLVESLEQQYADMIDEDPESDYFLSLQSTKEWINSHQDKVAGLFRYLKSLSQDDL